MMPARFSRLPVWGLIGIIPASLFWRLIFDGQVLYWGVPLIQFYPWHTLINRALSAGHWPLWTDLLGNGAPLLANHQTALFYPPNLLLRWLPVEHAMGYLVILHLVGAVLAAYLWGHILGLGRLGCAVLALSYGLNGYVVGRTQFITMVAAYTWLPLLLALAERVRQRRTLFDALWLGGAMALQFLAGHAQTWFYSGVLLASYAVYRLLHFARRETPSSPTRALTGKPALQTLGYLALAVLICLSLVAAQWLPTAELTVHSQRSRGADWKFAMAYSFWPWRLLTLVVPDLFGNPAAGTYFGYGSYWEDAAYVGILPLILACNAVVVWLTRRSRLDAPGNTALGVVPFFAVLLPVAVLLALGRNTPLYPAVFNYVPGFSYFQAPARLMLWFALAISTLAGIGAHHFWLTYRRQYVLRLTLAASAAMLVAALVVGQLAIPHVTVMAPAVFRSAVLLALTSCILLLRGPAPGQPDPRVRGGWLPRSVWSCLVVGLIGADLYGFAVVLTPTLPDEVYHAKDFQAQEPYDHTRQTRLYIAPTLEFDILFKRFFRFDTFGPSEPGHWQQLRLRHLPNLNVLDEIPVVNNYDPLVIGRWRELLDKTAVMDWPVRRQLLRTMNVDYVAQESGDAPPVGLTLVAGTSSLYRLSDPLPRAWWVSQALVVADAAEALSQITSPTFDPASQVILESPDRLVPLVQEQNHANQPSTTVVALHEGWNGRTIDVTVPQSGYLVLAYTYYPGWQATVDGEPAAILRANYAFMALPIGAGQHCVVLTYQPWTFRWGVVTSGLTLLVLLAVVCTSAYRKRSQQKSPRENSCCSAHL